jgi:putative ABC transport system permease protein
VALATLGLGVGLATAIFAVADGVLLRPLPYPQPERLVRIHDTNPAKGIEQIGGASGNVADWRMRVPELAGISGYFTMGRNLQTAAGAEVVMTAQVSTDFFPLLGVHPEHGRTFTTEETDRALFNSAAAPVGADPVAILSHRIWAGRFGSDPGLIGRKITLERREFEVVGVMPPGFAFPGPEVDLWIPWSWQNDPPRDQHYLGVVARLAPGATLATAQARLDGVTAALGEAFPETNRGWGARLTPLHDALVGGTRPVLVAFAVAGLVLLALAAVDLAGLQLVRATGRLEEMAVRLALGASRGRLVRGLLTENAVLAALGAALAVGVAAAALAGLPRQWPDLPRVGEVALDARAVAAAVLAAVAVAVAAGVVPALAASRAGATGLRVDGGRTTAGPARGRLRRALIVAEVALTVVLLAGAGLVVKSFARLAAVETGFDPRGVVVAPIFLDMQGYGSGEAVRGYYARLFERLAAIPGVEAVGGATALPASPLGPDFERPVWAEGTTPDPGTAPQADVRMVTPDYFRTLGIPLGEGRVFAAADGPEAPKVAIVNARLAALLWPDESAVGRRIVTDYSSAGTYAYDVVGVVGDVRFRGPRSTPRPEIFFPHAQRSYLVLNVAAKTSGDARALVPAVHGALREVDPAQPPQQVTPLADLASETVARDRLATELLSGFAAAAMALAALGIYGVLAHRVRQRQAEIAVRLALGARPVDVAGSVCGDGARLALAGGAVGVAVALAAGEVARGLLFEVAPTDPTIFAGVLVAVLAVALGAAGLPAVRASRVEPREALR